MDVTRRLRRSVVDLAPLFGDGDVITVRLGRTAWHIGWSPEWTKYVIGSHSMWADLDILPLGLAGHAAYYGMGGLPGAPPERHRTVRTAAVRTGFTGAPKPSVLESALRAAVELARRRGSGELDLAMFARALFLVTTAATVMDLDLDSATVRRILDWFDRWTKIMSSPLIAVGGPALPFTPANRLRRLLGPWYGYLADLLAADAGGGGLLTALRDQVACGDIARQEAVGYLATILFAGTEPPAHTLLWAHALITAVEPDELGPVDAGRADVLLWEALRAQPAIGVVVRRVCAADGGYRSASPDTYVVAPPLTHRRSDARNGLPSSFRPLTEGPTRLDPDEYPGLGAGFHHCVGARLGMSVARQALLFLLAETTVRRRPDLAPHGLITSAPRRLPVVTL
ncbi:MAG TPA: hypothetical protein VJT49_13920 [Amycolatopsis sp.]|uniref:hypothetical protein n=1 Tax=Amycolatopsis sp. TaxID=37632 RepID=UPI002B4A5D25|nr:hypothetical protein [Amycolatopsis sp.]HKS46180.1 hypothetical protein [Amycolatopsis sp.]